MMRTVLLLLLFVCFVCVSVGRNEVGIWSGEWGVTVASGVAPDFLDSLGFTVVRPLGALPDTYVVRHQVVTAQHPAALVSSAHATLQNHGQVVVADMQYKKKMYTRTAVTFPDPLFPQQWHLVNTEFPGQDINISGAWDLGFSGRGVRIAVVDDGYQYDHPDLAVGYQASSSYNINDGTPDPAPQSTMDRHGTSAAGVALASNNSVCGVGAAYGAQGSGIRLIADWFSDADSSYALTFANQDNFIYSNSWGPSDDGETIEGPGRFTLAAMTNSIENGRGGLGTVYVFAAGNGLMANDNCNYDGFVNSRYTIGVGAVTNTGVQSPYSEPCAAMLVTAPSNGGTKGITTTDLLGADGYSADDCTATFGGTSSACPLAAGVIALMLEANPKLTWLDVQYVLLQTAEKNDPTDADWTLNGAGYHINHKYGFGRVNAFAAVHAAIDYETTTTAHLVSYEKLYVNATIPDDGSGVGLNVSVRVDQEVIMEHVKVSVNIPNFWAAGDLKLVLTSPSGTKSVLAEQHGTRSVLKANLPHEPSFPDPADYFDVVQTAFGPTILSPLNGTLAIPQPSSEACGTVENITNCADLQGKLALVDLSSNCNATEQVYNAQQCGSIGVVIVNNYAGEIYQLRGTNTDITISSVMISLDSGLTIKGLMNTSGTVFLSIFPAIVRANLTFNGWNFSTVRNWGEKSNGNWSLEVIDTLPGMQGQLVSWDLHIYGYPPPKGPLKIAGWIFGAVGGSLVVLIFVVSGVLYMRSKRVHYQAV